jgi:hypothetical protein
LAIITKFFKLICLWICFSTVVTSAAWNSIFMLLLLLLPTVQKQSDMKLIDMVENKVGGVTILTLKSLSST